MQRELDRLKQQVGQVSRSVEAPMPMIVPVDNWTLQSGDAERSSLSSSVGVVSPASFPSTLNDGLMETPVQKMYSDTMALSLDGQEFEPEWIDDCFTLYAIRRFKPKR
jgi:hypothetical protein